METRRNIEAGTEQRFAAIVSGVDGFLAKPFLNDVLIDRVRTMLKSKHHVDELRMVGA